MTDRYLTIYLRDHLAMARGGLEFARRVINANEANMVGTRLEVLIVDLEEEAAALTRVLEILDIEPSQLKMAGVWLAEKAGRLKFNGEFVRYSPLSRLLELEFLMAATQTRRGLWRTLTDLCHMVPELEEVSPQRFASRCDDHLEMLTMLHKKAARSMLKHEWRRDERRRRSDRR